MSAVDAGDDADEHVLRRGAGRLEPVDVVGVVDDDEPDAVLDGQRDLLVALGVAVQDDSAGSTPAFSAVRISPPPATSSPRPSSTITRWTAVHGNALEAKTTRERGQRAASSSAYSRARARSAGSATTSAGVPNSAASSSARQPAIAQHAVGVERRAGREQRQQRLAHAATIIVTRAPARGE